MNKGYLIYNRDDYEKNVWFADEFINKAGVFNMEIELLLTDEISLVVDEDRLSVVLRGSTLEKPDFVINRSRDSLIGVHFELMGCRVFNNSRVTELCNNKAKTHQLVNSNGIRSVKTMLCNKSNFNSENLILKPPFVLKGVSGHGGGDVYKTDKPEDIEEKLALIPDEQFVLQEMCGMPGIDIRVFVVGKQTVAAVKRHSEKDFKSNYSLGGIAEAYSLNQQEKALVDSVAALLDFDFVGIDFILDSDGRLLFNEIEDVVGTRTLYANYDLDIVMVYLDYINKVLAENM
jgi:gamma-F420-2:alpha-L-glutamate ligase